MLNRKYPINHNMLLATWQKRGAIMKTLTDINMKVLLHFKVFDIICIEIGNLRRIAGN